MKGREELRGESGYETTWKVDPMGVKLKNQVSWMLGEHIHLRSFVQCVGCSLSVPKVFTGDLKYRNLRSCFPPFFLVWVRHII